MQEQLIAQGLDGFAIGPSQMRALLESDLERYGKLIKSAGIKIE